MKRRIITVLIFVSILFINMPLVKVKADSRLNCPYGIVCEYRFCDEKGVIGSCPLNFGTNVVRVAFRCKNSDKGVNSCEQFTAFSAGCRALGDGSNSSLNIGFSVPNAEDQMLDTGSVDCTKCLIPEGEGGEDCDYYECIENNKEWPVGSIGVYFERKGGYECPPLQIDGSNNSYNGILQENKIQGTSIRCINFGEDTSNAKMQEESCGVTDSLIKESVEEQEESLKDEDDENDGSIIEAILQWGMGSGSGTKYSGDAADPCDLISGDIQELLHKIFFGISVAGIIILVVMTAVSLAKVITASEDEALRNFFKGLWKRLICLIILLLLPMIVTFIIQLVNNAAPGLGIRSDNPLCNITE